MYVVAFAVSAAIIVSSACGGQVRQMVMTPRRARLRVFLYRSGTFVRGRGLPNRVSAPPGPNPTWKPRAPNLGFPIMQTGLPYYAEKPLGYLRGFFFDPPSVGVCLLRLVLPRPGNSRPRDGPA
jgi:hypothetical protein